MGLYPGFVNRMKALRAMGVIFGILSAALAVAAEGDAARAAIQSIAPLQQVHAFRRSALPGYFEGVIAGQIAYASEDGRYLLRGSVRDTSEKVDLSEASMAQRRLQVLGELGEGERISFAPASPKYRLTVFTDVDCPFCRRLHAQIDQYTALGIAIDYVFFPLSIHPGADRKSIAVWCSDDRKHAYAAAVMGQAVGSAMCDNPLVRMRQAGDDIGVGQTPTAIAEDGSVIDSTVLMSPMRLLTRLKEISTHSASTPPARSVAVH